ncbi:hypothetical protein Poli38472_004019 [Pythium oligandrum]|uniref:Uncharacterized protein n=1 Tax=Pythium oligandrum TaxID=41045 RepID=A0A8K1FMG4_PYTOL|nr:hypothetical protein Poli38472_004019 [Pythium oligandrum]|eukprot:TMW66254.1 hypothetical protein Poli38472_004019 [Pythium oligandrum]
MSAWGLRLNPFSTSYSSLETDQMHYIRKAYCEAMEVGEEDLPAQLKMDDSFYPLYKPSVSDFDEHTFMRKMRDVVGLLRNPAEAIISSICAYQRERHERLTFGGYLNDPRTLLLEEFKDWAMRTLAPASCTTESILNEVRRRHSYVLRLQHGQQGLFQAGSGERSLLGTLKDVRNVIENRILPTIEAERAHSSAREQLHTLEARGTDGLMHGVQFLFYVLRNTPNTPGDCTITNLQSQQHAGMKDAMQSKSGQMLQLLLTTPSFKTLFPETPNSQQKDTPQPLLLTAEEEADMVTSAVFCDDQAKAQVPAVLTRTLRGNAKSEAITPVDYFGQSNSGVVPLRQESAVIAYDTFTRLHGLLKLLADLLVSCRKARQLAGPGGDLLVYGPGGEEVRRLMQSLEIVQGEISRLVTKLTQIGVRELDRLKPNQEKAWRYSFSKVLPLENYLAHDFGACVEPIQRIYQNADPVHVQKMYKQFRQATGMWVQENNSLCRNVYAAMGAAFVERLPSKNPQFEIEDEQGGPQIELIEDDAPQKKTEKDKKKKNSNAFLLENGPAEETNGNSRFETIEENSMALVPANSNAMVSRSSATKPNQESGVSLFSTAATIVSWIANSKKPENSPTKARPEAQSPQNSETDDEDMEKAPMSSASSVSSNGSSAVAATQGVLDTLLLVRQSIQRIGQLSWGLRTSFHTANIDEGDFDAYIALCSIYQMVGVQCASDLLIRIRHHRTRLAQLLKRHVSSILSCVLVLQGRIVDENKSLQGMSLLYRHLESIMNDFENDLDALLTHFKQSMVECGKMRDGVLTMPLLNQKEDNTGVSPAMYAFNSINELTTKVSKVGGGKTTPSAAVLTHGEYMRQISSQMDLHWNSISHLLQSLKGTLEAVTTVNDRLREYARDTHIVVPPQQLDYIFEYNYDGFFSQSTKDLEQLLTTFQTAK